MTRFIDVDLETGAVRDIPSESRLVWCEARVALQLLMLSGYLQFCSSKGQAMARRPEIRGRGCL